MLSKPVKFLTAGYIAGLSLIAGMSVGAHYVAKKVISEQENSAKTVNLAGRQRMLSQRSALYLSKLSLNPADLEIRGKLSSAIDLFEKSHVNLLGGEGDAVVVPGLSAAEAEKVYFNEPDNLDRMVKEYILNVRGFLSLPPEDLPYFDKVAETISLAEGVLLQKLDGAVKAYEVSADTKIADLAYIQTVTIYSVIAMILIEAVLIFRPLVNRVSDYSSRLESLAKSDPLTGVANRRMFFECLNEEFMRAKRYERPLSLLILDLDHFKSVNDTYGHPAGDTVLKTVSKLISNNIRNQDLFGRVGGEEFCVLFPETDITNAKVVASKILGLLQSELISVGSGHKLDKIVVTSSIGLAEIDHIADEDADQLYKRADKALYEAKENGRNQVRVAA